MQRNLIFYKILAQVLACICLCLAFYSFKTGLSSLISIRPESYIVKWEEDPHTFNYKDAKSIQTRLHSSISHTPFNPFHKILLGRLHLLLAFYHQSEPVEKNYHLQKAEVWIHKSIQQMPTWHEGWSLLAIISLRSNEDSSTFNQKLKKAMSLGAYEDITQKLLIPLMLKNWGNLNSENQQKAMVIFRHGLAHWHNAKLVIDSARDAGKLEFISPHATKVWQINLIKKYKNEGAQTI